MKEIILASASLKKNGFPSIPPSSVEKVTVEMAFVGSGPKCYEKMCILIEKKSDIDVCF